MEERGQDEDGVVVRFPELFFYVLAPLEPGQIVAIHIIKNLIVCRHSERENEEREMVECEKRGNNGRQRLFFFKRSFYIAMKVTISEKTPSKDKEINLWQNCFSKP